MRTPHPLNRSGDRSRRATASALSASRIPVHRQWPMLEARASMGFLSRSRPMASQPRSSSQKSRLKFALRSAALCRSLVERAASPCSAAKNARAR